MNIYHNSNLLQTLSDLGIDEKQAKIYLAALKLGGGSVTKLAKAAGLERTGLYYHLKMLINLGLIKESTVKKRTSYLPANPLRLKDILLKKNDELEKVLPELENAFASQIGKSLSTYYQGKEGLISLYEDFYKVMRDAKPPNNTFMLFSRHSDVMKIFPEYFPHLIKRVMKLPLVIKSIIPKSHRLKKKIDPDNLNEYIEYLGYVEEQNRKYLDDEYFPQTVILIMNDYVATIDYNNFFGTIIESKNMADAWRKFFQFIWDNLE